MHFKEVVKSQYFKYCQIHSPTSVNVSRHSKADRIGRERKEKKSPLKIDVFWAKVRIFITWSYLSKKLQWSSLQINGRWFCCRLENWVKSHAVLWSPLVYNDTIGYSFWNTRAGTENGGGARYSDLKMYRLLVLKYLGGKMEWFRKQFHLSFTGHSSVMLVPPCALRTEV